MCDNMIYISEYFVTREYGGPEEGGWWYNNRTFKRIVATTDSKMNALNIVVALNQKAREDRKESGDYELDSVLCDGVYEYDYEDSPGENETTEKPHYE
jgi:hypothetical protein